ncbi:mTERF domain-containing protein 1, mitochondrial [Toxocara canis]|uniref:mTERF domain-containing protein 1, mitochondrial n=1 Tax=Toxocara canis TaxID=6265 RepID=A0A0B2V2N2_TOXCA|nr:mTERF domain-containing protein 1, mitochondrial [Toxocara canis]
MLALRLAGRRLIDSVALSRLRDLGPSKALRTNPSPPTPLVVDSAKDDVAHDFGSSEMAAKDDSSYATGKDSKLDENALKDEANRQKLRRKWMKRRAHAGTIMTRISRMRARDAALADNDAPMERAAKEGEASIFGAEQELQRRAEEIVRILREEETRDNDAVASAEVDEKPNELSKEEPSVHVNRFRRIIYSEGELDASDLSQPPSRTNPHPFDPSSTPSLLPPTHSRSLAEFVNHLPVLQNLVELGVDLLEVDTNNDQLGRHLVRLNWDRDVRPKLEWLLEIGIPLNQLGSYLTKNPFFLIMDLSSMKVRVNYLYSKKFTKKQIVKIITEFRYWLNTDVRTMDSRLGWIQKSFSLSGDEVRLLIVKEPRIVMFGVAPLQRLRNTFLKEMEFTEEEVKKMLLEDPRLFLMDVSHVTMSYAYLHYSMGLANGQLVNFPLALRCSVASIRRRHEYLVKLKRDNYFEDTPDSISLQQLLHPSDKYFAVNVARTFLAAYNQFLKTY